MIIHFEGRACAGFERGKGVPANFHRLLKFPQRSILQPILNGLSLIFKIGLKDFGRSYLVSIKLSQTLGILGKSLKLNFINVVIGKIC